MKFSAHGSAELYVDVLDGGEGTETWDIGQIHHPGRLAPRRCLSALRYVLTASLQVDRLCSDCGNMGGFHWAREAVQSRRPGLPVLVKSQSRPSSTPLSPELSGKRLLTDGDVVWTPRLSCLTIERPFLPSRVPALPLQTLALPQPPPAATLKFTDSPHPSVRQAQLPTGPKVESRRLRLP